MFENTLTERTERSTSRWAVALSATLQYMGGPVRRSRFGIFGGSQGTHATSTVAANESGLRATEPRCRWISGRGSTPSSLARSCCPLMAGQTGRGRSRGRPQTRTLPLFRVTPLAVFTWLFACVPFATGQVGDTADAAMPTSIERPNETRIQQQLQELIRRNRLRRQLGSHFDAIRDTCSVSEKLLERFRHFVGAMGKLNRFIEESLGNESLDSEIRLHLMHIDLPVFVAILQIEDDDIISWSPAKIQETSDELRIDFDLSYRSLYRLDTEGDHFDYPDYWATEIMIAMKCL